jgi:hypothetical protein
MPERRNPSVLVEHLPVEGAIEARGTRAIERADGSAHLYA